MAAAADTRTRTRPAAVAPAPALALTLLLLCGAAAVVTVSAFSPCTTTTTKAVFARPATALYAAKKKKTAKSSGGGGGGGGGFGANTKSAPAVAAVSDDNAPFTPVRNRGPNYDFATLTNNDDDEEEEDSIEHYLNPRLFEDPSTLDDVRARLRAGEIVVLRDAFKADFARAMHAELLSTTSWSRNEAYLDDGYHYRHYNVYDKADYSEFYNATLAMLDTDKSKAFMTDVTGRDCTGDTVGSPSYYGGGDHSLPHTDHFGQRTVAYVWHLSEKWRPEWGGGLYWAPEPLANAYLHASFNTLVLFSVTPLSSHFVTTVSPHAGKGVKAGDNGGGPRLSFNGWWQSKWVPTLDDNVCADNPATTVKGDGGGGGVPLEDMLDTPSKRLRLTYDQYVAIEKLLFDPWSPRVEPPERREALEGLMKEHMEESYPKPRSPPM